MAWVLAAVSALVFAASWRRDPRRLRNGVFAIAAALLITYALVTTPGQVGTYSAGLVGVLLGTLVPIGYVALVGFLFTNGVVVLRRERLSLGLLLPLLAAVAMIVVPLGILWALSQHYSTYSMLWVMVGVTAGLITGYVSLTFLTFLTFGLMYGWRVRRRSADAVLVLGSRVINGKVPPLLASRIDRGIAVFRQAEQKGDPLPLLVMCGGQGPDEDLAEATAMASYAREQGIPDEFLVEENQSTTTWQNLRFGSKLVTEQRDDARLLVATNDYHTLRTALLTYRMGLPAQVVAARTARYYFPAAFLREFVAVMRDYWRIHAIAIALIVGVILLGWWESVQMR